MPAAGVLLGRLPWARAEELPDYGLLRSTLPSFFLLLRACFAYDFCARWILPVLAGAFFSPLPQRADQMMCMTFVSPYKARIF